MKFSFGLAKKASEGSAAAAKLTAVKPPSIFAKAQVHQQPEGEDLLEIVGDEFRTEGGVSETVVVIPCKNRLPNPRGKRDFEAAEEETLGSVEITDGLNFVGRRRRERRASSDCEGASHSPTSRKSPERGGDDDHRASSTVVEEETSEDAARGQLSTSEVEDLRRKLGMVKKRRNLKGDVPLLKRNVEGVGRDLSKDLELLPDVNPMDHDAVSIEVFGDAMLRGMGYEPKKSKEEEIKKPEETFRSLAGWRSAGLGTDAEMKQNKAKLDTNAQKRRGKIV